MTIPTIQGIIERRMLINFTIDPDIAQSILPAPFKIKLYRGKAIAGICLIRLRELRPKGLPNFISFSSENAAHRIAIEWTENGVTKEGVYIPRRDTSSRLNSVAGGRIFPGKHFHANFDVKEEKGHYHVGFNSSDGASISVDAVKTNNLNSNSIFSNFENVSAFFKCGAIGYSPNGKQFDGLELKIDDWKAEPLAVTHVHSSFFEDESIFPKGSVQFDNALLMTEVRHEWHSVNGPY